LIYVDTSVLVAFYSPEPLSGKAERVVRGSDRPALCDLAQVEFASAVARKVRERELSPADGRRILARFRSHIDSGLYDRLALEPSHLEMARDWIGQLIHPLRTLDALHFAVAASAGLPLVTSDRILARAGRAFGVSVRLVR